MRFPKVLIRLLTILCIIVVIGVGLQWPTLQQRLQLLTKQDNTAPQQAPLIVQQPTETPTLFIPNTPDRRQWSLASSDATATPSPPTGPPSCGGTSRVTGVVLLPDGAPAANVAVQSEASPTDCWPALTDETGQFVFSSLAAGTWVLRAWPHIRGDAANPLYPSPFFTITVDGVTPVVLSAPIQLTGPQVIGTIRLASGQPGVALAIGVAKVIGDPDCGKGSVLGPNGAGTISDEAGHFRIGGLSTLGLHCILITDPTTQHLLFAQFATLTTPQTQIDLGVVNTLALPKHVTGTVRDSNGEAIDGTISAGRLGEGPNIGFMIQTDKTGHYAFDVEPGTWEIYIFPSSANPNPHELENLDVSQRMQVVTFAEEPSLETRVVDFVLQRPNTTATTDPAEPQRYTLYMPLVTK